MSFVGLSGPWVGTGVIICSARLACRLSAALLMYAESVMNDEVLDCVGEITNMIIGNFKTDAEHILGTLTLSVPTVSEARARAWFRLPRNCPVRSLY
jgi:CheY-specific phosphatase CheX